MDEEQVTALKADSVYSEEYGSGEITGQITAVDPSAADTADKARDTLNSRQ